MTITNAQLRGLEAVGAGKVRRIYRRNGNVIRGDGISSSLLRRLEHYDWIEDGPLLGGLLETTYQMMLSHKGRNILDRFARKDRKV